MTPCLPTPELLVGLRKVDPHIDLLLPAIIRHLAGMELTPPQILLNEFNARTGSSIQFVS